MDDTDSRRGGCTTWVLTELLSLARETGVDLLGEPRLVRLNPNIPWKTRGNGALAAHFGVGSGPGRTVGSIGGRPVRSYARGRPLSPLRAERFREAAWQRVLERSERGSAGTDPAMVAAERPLPTELYWQAVREVVPVGSTLNALRRAGAWWRTDGDPRGLIGASAAIAWPARRVTWELTAYRTEPRIGLRRVVDADSVRTVAAAHPSLFLCEDPRTRRILVSPHTNCPVLYGLRSTRPGPLLRARSSVRSEPVDRWVLFRTNQGTGDHLVSRSPRDLGPFRAARFAATVASPPEVRRGGHVALHVVDEAGGRVECVAFEPTKTLPRVAQQLAPGDRVQLWGSRGDDPVVRLEGIRLVRLVPRAGRRRSLRCPECGTTAGSLGSSKGYRCPACHRRFPPEASRRPRLEPPLRLGDYHPTPSARRHLAPRGPEP